VKALENIRKTLDAEESGRRSLIALTDDVPPLAQVAIGNLDTARNVSFTIPGMNTFTTDMIGWTRAAQNIYDAQHRVDESGSFAVVAWIGYKTPPVPVSGGDDFGVLMGDYARAGADRLAADLAGFNASRSGTLVSLDIIAHSYGTTTAATALAEHDFHVDSFVMVGSAGIEQAVGGAKGINASKVYAGQADDSYPWLSGDPWAWTGRLGSGRQNPITPGFGATVFGADGEPDDPKLHPTTAHDAVSGTDKDDSYGYLDRGSESLRNVALATTGRGREVTPDQQPSYSASNPYLPYNPYAPSKLPEAFQTPR